MSERFCTVEDLKRQAITIKLYNNSVWANLGDGRFINRQTKQIRPISLLYRSTRTVVGVNHQVIAKRRKKRGCLLFLEKPYKAKGAEVGHTYYIVTPYVDPATKKVITTVESTYTAKSENETIHVDIPIAKNTMTVKKG